MGISFTAVSFFKFAPRWDGWSTPHPSRFTRGKDIVLIVYDAGWAAGPFWTVAEYLSYTGIRYPNLPARSEPLHRLRYSGPIVPSTAT